MIGITLELFFPIVLGHFLPVVVVCVVVEVFSFDFDFDVKESGITVAKIMIMNNITDETIITTGLNHLDRTMEVLFSSCVL
jgi:hypothetical protein